MLSCSTDIELILHFTVRYVFSFLVCHHVFVSTLRVRVNTKENQRKKAEKRRNLRNTDFLQNRFLFFDITQNRLSFSLFFFSCQRLYFI